MYFEMHAGLLMNWPLNEICLFISGNIFRHESFYFWYYALLNSLLIWTIFPLMYFQPIYILYLKYTLFGRHFAYCIHSDKSFLIGIYGVFMYNVNTDRVGPTSLFYSLHLYFVFSYYLLLVFSFLWHNF